MGAILEKSNDSMQYEIDMTDNDKTLLLQAQTKIKFEETANNFDNRTPQSERAGEKELVEIHRDV